MEIFARKIYRLGHPRREHQGRARPGGRLHRLFCRVRAGRRLPWQDEKVTSCVLDPTMNYPDPGEVIREDGSKVAF